MGAGRDSGRVTPGLVSDQVTEELVEKARYNLIQGKHARSAQILAFTAKYIEAHGHPPTVREIGQHFNIKTQNGVRYHLDWLVGAGKLVRDNKVVRGIRLRMADESKGG